MNPLELSGPHFLAFYPIAFAVILILLLITRATLRKNVPPPRHGLQLDEYELAYLAGGAVRAVQTALVAMGTRDLIRFKAKGFYAAIGPSSLRSDHRIERDVEEIVRSAPGITFQRILNQVRSSLQPLDDRLASVGYIVPRATRSLYSVIGVFGVFLMMALAVAKIYVGLSRGKPIEFLIVEAVVALVILCTASAMQPRLTAAGKEMIAEWKARIEAGRVPVVDPNAAPAMLNVALFGPALLAGTALAEFQTPLQQYSGAGGDGGGGGSSCGGGGGCGGGGCGGCGGG